MTAVLLFVLFIFVVVIIPGVYNEVRYRLWRRQMYKWLEEREKDKL
jgi:hypothetical protein